MCIGVERCLPLCQQQQQQKFNQNNRLTETIGGDVTRLPFRLLHPNPFNFFISPFPFRMVKLLLRIFFIFKSLTTTFHKF